MWLDIVSWKPMNVTCNGYRYRFLVIHKFSIDVYHFKVEKHYKKLNTQKVDELDANWIFMRKNTESSRTVDVAEDAQEYKKYCCQMKSQSSY